jgi:hypothetical protein
MALYFMAIIQSITVLRTGKGGRRGGVGLMLTYKNTPQRGENITFRKDMEKTRKIAKGKGTRKHNMVHKVWE